VKPENKATPSEPDVRLVFVPLSENLRQDAPVRGVSQQLRTPDRAKLPPVKIKHLKANKVSTTGVV
jgi:hypothetical protein